LLLAACGAHPAAPAAPAVDAALTAKVDAYLAPYVEMRDFAGTVVVARGDRVVVRRGYGDAPAAAPYAVGSIAKTVTAAAIELLEARGKLATADPVGRYVDGLSYGERVTIRQLLEHRAGIPDYYGFPEFAARHAEDIPLAGLVSLIATKPLDFEPGSDTRYSNSGYALLAATIERAAGERYGGFVARELLAPLGMARSGDLTSGRPGDLAPGRDPGFEPTLVQPAAALGAGWLAGNGSLYTTADDLLRWARAARSATPVAAPDRPGWGVHDRAGHKIVEQDGRISGYAAYVGVSLDDDVTVIALGNIQSQAIATIGPDVGDLARGRPVSTPAVRPRPRAPEPPLSSFEGRYRVAPGFALTIAAAPGGLTLSGPDRIATALDREGPTAFFFRTLYVEISFTPGADGRATALLWAGAAFPRDDAAPGSASAPP